MLERKLDVLFVNVGGTKKRIYQELSKDLSAIEPPFWAALSAGFMKNKGFGVDVLDANAENLTHEKTAKTIQEISPNLTNIVVYGQHPSASTQLMTEVGQLCKEIKKINPQQKIILSGLHPSALPERTLKEEECDFVCEGEGFYTLLGLAEKGDVSKIPGLWFEKEGKIFHNPRAENVQNLTLELKDVAWDLLPLNQEKYRAHNWQCLDNFEVRSNYASLSTSLGCPFKCDFCSIHKTFGVRKVRYWEPSWVVNQIENLVENYGVKIFKIIDETFILNPKHYLSIVKDLKDRGLGKEINIWAYTRVDTINEKNLQELKKGGLKWLCFGFESGNENILKKSHKGNFTKQDMVDISNKTRASGINIIANYMFGFPEDNLDTMQETLDLALKQNCEFANFYCSTAWPGSDLYKRVVSEMGELQDSWADFAQHSYAFKPLPTNYLSSSEVLQFRDESFQKYFSDKKYLKMIERKFGGKAKEHIINMNKSQLKRKILED